MTKKFNQSGFSQIIVLLLLLLGVGIAVFLTQKPQTLTPKADVSYQKQTRLSLVTKNNIKNFTEGEKFKVKLTVRSDLAAAKKILAEIKYDSAFLGLQNLDVDNHSQFNEDTDPIPKPSPPPKSSTSPKPKPSPCVSCPILGITKSPKNFVDNWYKKNVDQTQGIITLGATATDEGLKTIETEPETPIMATFQFKVLKAGSTAIILTENSAMYTGLDAKINGLSRTSLSPVIITAKASPTPKPSLKGIAH